MLSFLQNISGYKKNKIKYVSFYTKKKETNLYVKVFFKHGSCYYSKDLIYDFVKEVKPHIRRKLMILIDWYSIREREQVYNFFSEFELIDFVNISSNLCRDLKIKTEIYLFGNDYTNISLDCVSKELLEKIIEEKVTERLKKETQKISEKYSKFHKSYFLLQNIDFKIKEMGLKKQYVLSKLTNGELSKNDIMKYPDLIAIQDELEKLRILTN